MVLPRNRDEASNAGPGGTNAGKARKRAIWALTAFTWSTLAGPLRPSPLLADPQPAATAHSKTASAADAVAHADRRVAGQACDAPGNENGTMVIRSDPLVSAAEIAVMTTTSGQDN
jgi:hypothetical protein